MVIGTYALSDRFAAFRSLVQAAGRLRAPGIPPAKLICGFRSESIAGPDSGRQGAKT